MSVGTNRTQLVLLGVFVVIVLGLFGYLALRVGSVRTSDGVEVDVLFDDAQGLIENGSVKIAGISVGAITKLKVEGKKARVSLVLDPESNVRTDVRATIKAKSLLGEKFIELQPESETAPLLKTGDTITNSYVSAELPDLASQIGPLLAKINPDDVSRMVRVISRVLENSEESIPKAVESLGNIAINVDGLVQRNGPKIEKIIDVTYDTISTSGPKLNKLVDTTQRTMDNANSLLEDNGPKLSKFTDQLSKVDMEGINKMIGEAPATFAQATQVVTKVNTLLDGFEGLSWYEMKNLIRDEGINVRLTERSDDDKEEDRAKWGTPTERKGKVTPAVSTTPAN